MQFDTSDCFRKPFDSLQGEVAKGIMPNKNILIINHGPNIGIELRDFENEVRSTGVGLGNLGIWSGARWIIYCDQGFRD
jgi:hypothetical protein